MLMNSSHPLIYQLSITYPDWEGVEQLWSAYFEELKYDTETHPMFVLDSPFSSDASRDRLTTLMVSSSHVASLLYAISIS